MFPLLAYFVVAACALAVPSVADAAPTAADRDRDGLSDAFERKAGTNVRKADSDRDRTPDAMEDADRDGVDNGNEEAVGSHPRKRDSDRDGKADGREDKDRDGLTNRFEDVTGNDPVDADTDDDGTKDGAEKAGRIVSFSDDVLTIQLVSGKRFSAAVDEDTAVDCATEDAFEDAVEDDEDAEEDEEDTEEEDSDGGVELEVIEDDSEGDDGEDDGSDDSDSDEGDEDDSFEDDIETSSCPTPAFKPGRWVNSADLRLEADGPVFESLWLVLD